MRIIAHRACPLHAAENSLAGVKVARSLGADAVEIDVRLTSDGVPVLNHDRTFWRTARSAMPVDRMSSEHFAKLRERKSGAPMPSLAEVLPALPAGLDMALDLKAPDALRPAVALLEDRGMLHRASFWVRDEEHVRKAAKLAPDNERALLRNTYTPGKTSRYLQDAVDCGATAVSIHQRGLTYEAVWESLAKGLTTYCWVIEFGDLVRVIDTGVHGIVVDSPDLARQIVN
ncbi:MAG TPA: glycerophosphodiester phosphodiesterase [Acidimicrobiales bacterium]|nr:glycerophosphodiester phosphodiesterase [Acidimicrobiales bacterium]